MKTKLISIAMILMLSGSLAMAQGYDKVKTSFGLIGGINFQNLTGKDASGDKLANDLILGYHAGVNIQIPLAPQFYFQPGLLFSTKGAKNSYSSITSTTKLSYIEMPLNLVYKAMLGNGYFMLGFGPYIGYGIGGKVTTKGGDLELETDVEFKNVVETSDPLLTTYYKAFDVGGNIFAGYQMANGIFGQFNTQLGLIAINPEDKRVTSDDSSVKNTGFGVSVGFRF
ncbi:MAG: outer membrane beta-barrel protein [Bacteroidales bacterium]